MANPQPGESLLLGQKRVLELVATGAPLAETLDELARFIEAQEPGLRCGILIVADDGAHFRRGAGPNLPEAYHQALDGGSLAPPYRGVCAEAAHRNCAIAVPDIAADPRWSEQWRGLVLGSGLKACLSTPVRGSDGRVLGAFAMYYDLPRDPSPAHPELVEIATHLAGIALERERAAQALRERETQLRMALEIGRQGVWDLDLARMTLNASDKCKANFGYAPDQPFGYEQLREAIHPDDRGMQAEAVGKAIGEKSRFDIEYRCITPQGEQRWIAVAGRFEEGAAGPRLFGVSTDITARQEAQEALRASEGRLRAVFDNRAMGVAVMTPAARFVQVNEAFCAVTGYSAEELRALDCETLTHPDDRAHMNELIEGLLSGARTTFVIDKRYRRKDGAEVRVRNSVSLTRDERGRPRHLIALCQDVTDRHRAQALAASQKDAFELAAAGAPVEAALDVLARAARAQSRQDTGVALCLVEADGARLRFGAAAGVPEAFARVLDGLTVGPQAPACGAAAHAGKAVIVRDVAQDPLWAPYLGLAREHGIRASWSFPIRSFAKVLGTFTLYRREPGEPQPRDFELAGQVAQTAAILIERHHAAEDLRQRNAQFEALFTAAPLGVYLVDADFRIRQVNPTALPEFAGISDLIGGDFNEVVRRLWLPDHADAIVRLFRRTLETGAPYAISEQPDGRHDSATRYYDWRIDRIPLPDGRFGVVCHFQDVSARVLARQAIAESEARFRSLFESAPVAVFVCDRAGVIQIYNAQGAHLWGREPVPGDPREVNCGSMRLRNPDGTVLPHADSPIVEVLRTGLPRQDIEVIIDRPDGSQVTVLVNFAPLRDAAGAVTGAVTSFVDISERKRAEAAVRDSEERLAAELADAKRLQEASMRLIAEGDPDGLYREILDTATAVMRSQAASMQMLDAERGELRLLSWTGFTAESAAFWRWVRPKSGSTCAVSLGSGQRVVVPDVETCEFMAGTADLDQYRRSSIRAVQSTPLTSRSGRLLGMISTHWREPHQPSARDLRLLDVLARQAADLIERAQSEAALRRSEQGLRELADAMPQLVWTADAQGQVLYSNRRRDEYYRNGGEGLDWQGLVHPADLDVTRDAWSRARATGQPYEIEHRLLGSDGGYAWHLSRAIASRDAAGRIVQWVGTATNIHAHKLREERVRLLMAEVNHRSKNLLAVTQAIARQTAATDGAAREFERAFSARLQGLSASQDLLIEQNWRGASLHDLARSQLGHYAELIGRRIEIEGPPFRLDPAAAQAIGMALHELSTNAAKYGALSNAAGTVRIRWALAGQGAAARLDISWIERGGPAVAAPARRGFGRIATETMLEQRFEGRVDLDYPPEGLRWRFAVPVGNVAAPDHRVREAVRAA